MCRFSFLASTKQIVSSTNNEDKVIAASGAVKHEAFVEEVKKLFTKLSTNPSTASQLVEKEPAVFTGSEVRMLDDDIPLAQFAVAFEGASWKDPDSIPLMIMQAMLGSWHKTAGGGKHMGYATCPK
ncbi:probable mitochondrial-processing peptidase subunit beta, mitochondrial [Trifolium pratense]|uniref:probable mitochondrial-processing peptidase subunit beta, mitochondrial n=1 Tax=Trifolium pratense TaxID=57577 RepID=UPI001E692571|nr:probable mitochondrial-processing peptidase subunit beta, mitochondrial [Trifolium pratense]XP_045818970.1 probable mitochondrial-processing peptidase subunit beta, mitochondrial [Trifolium pratense]XP_045818971.1 probable mitochondrial-processing peptidase subunit beta, mitochondrial [Trifolium pratense]XP_045818972.1 probable mitochondrial-processing peptidase subunit beta, mitochondrial [Trifolium pratense]XP_045818973.1 probable mitochondrial-processing peptidase subunit beta, mitochondr